jgi:hypothetical protein
METLQGRWQGNIEDGRFEGQSLFQRMIEEFFDQSVARDYLLREVSKDQCLGESFQGQVDLGLGKKWDLNRLDLVFQTGSQVSASGAPEELRGVFRAGSRCIRGDARKCLAGPSGQAELPFFVKNQKDDWSFQLDLGPLGNRLTDCLSDAVASSARQAIQRAVPDELRKKIQDVFKNR